MTTVLCFALITRVNDKMVWNCNFLLLLVLTTCILQCSGKGHGGQCNINSCKSWCVYGGETSGLCEPDYIPGGQQIVLEPIEAPTATLKENSAAQVAKLYGFECSIVGELIDTDGWGSGIPEFATKFSKGLGIFGCVLSSLGSLNTPNPYDIIDAVNKALGELTAEVNDQFKNMEAYVDQSIMQAQNQAMNTFLNYFGAKFANCLVEPTDDRFLICLDETERDIHAAQGSFMHYKNQMTDVSYIASSDDVKKMELEIVTFMDYAILRTVNLLTLYGVYDVRSDDVDGKPQTCRFLNALKNELPSFIDYTTFLYSTILKTHNQSTSEDFFYSNVDKGYNYDADCHEIYEGWTNVWTATDCKYKYRMSNMLVDTNDYRCIQKQTARQDNSCRDYCGFVCSTACDSCNSATGSMHHKASLHIYPLYVDYTKNMALSVKNYWQPQTTERLTTWREIIAQVDAKIQAKGCDSTRSEL